MTTTLSIDTTTDCGTIEKLQAGIDARSAALKQVTADSIVAASINILRSLKAGTAKAPIGPRATVDPAAYRIVATDMFGGLYVEKGTKANGGRPPAKICARVGSHYGPKANIRPAIGFSPGNRSVFRSRVYAISTNNPHDTFALNVNRPNLCWFVLCEHEGQAIAYAENRIRRIYSKESGMAKYALAIAQAQTSTRDPLNTSKAESGGKGGMSPRAAQIAFDAAEITIVDQGVASGVASVEFFDHLNYSTSAAGGEGALSAAIEKAANAMIGAYGTPEAKAAYLPHQGENPNAEIYNAFRAHWIARNSGSDKLMRNAPF